MTSTARSSHAQHKAFSDYVSMFTLDDLSYTPSAEEKERDAAQTFATGRKSFKTIKGKSEAVWPSYLEAALFEALQIYQPDNSKSSKHGRFPMRNKFISDHIYEVTGKRRTPRQVGSRLQQLRDTSGGKQLLDLYSFHQRHESEFSDLSSLDSKHDDDTLIMSVVSSPQAQNNPSSLPPSPQTDPPFDVYDDAHHTAVGVASYCDSCPPCAQIQITIQQENVSSSSSLGTLNTVEGRHFNSDAGSFLTSLTPHQNGATSASAYPATYHLTCSAARPLRAIDPSVTFSSPTLLSAHSIASVFFDCMDTPVHVEMSPLVCCSPRVEGGAWLYRTTLAPKYWHTICQNSDPTRYTIKQDIVQLATGASSGPLTSLSREHCDHIFTTIYRFKYATSTCAFPDAEPNLPGALEANDTADSSSMSAYNPHSHIRSIGLLPGYNLFPSLPSHSIADNNSSCEVGCLPSDESSLSTLHFDYFSNILHGSSSCRSSSYHFSRQDCNYAHAAL